MSSPPLVTLPETKRESASQWS